LLKEKNAGKDLKKAGKEAGATSKPTGGKGSEAGKEAFTGKKATTKDAKSGFTQKAGSGTKT